MRSVLGKEVGPLTCFVRCITTHPTSSVGLEEVELLSEESLLRTLATATGSVNFTKWLRGGGGLGNFLTLGKVNVLYDLEMELHVSKMAL